MLAVYLGIMAVGVGIVVFLFFIEGKKGNKSTEVAEAPGGNPGSIFNRSGPKEQEHSKSPLERTSAQAITPSAQETPLSRSPAKKQPDESQALLEENLKKTAELEELQTKHDKLDKLLTERNEELDKKSKELENEIRNRKEFNKVKDLLEKEIKDLRDKNHKQQLELAVAKAETENLNKRAVLLDEKISARDKDIKEKEKQIDELVKRMQTFALKPPITPPPVEAKVHEPAQEVREKSTETASDKLQPSAQADVQSLKEPASSIRPDEPSRPAVESESPPETPPSPIPPEMLSVPAKPEPAEPHPTPPEPQEPASTEPKPEIESTAEDEQPHLNLGLFKLPDEVKTNDKIAKKKPEIKLPPANQSDQNPAEQKPAKEDPA